MKKIKLMIAMIMILALSMVGTLVPQAEAVCYQCDHIFNSWFCFPGYPGRSVCVDTPTYCALSGAFCDIIIVEG